MLNDVELMEMVLDEYDMSAIDFFKFLFRICPTIFKGLFVKKVQKTLKGKQYAKTIKFGDYAFRKLNLQN